MSVRRSSGGVLQSPYLGDGVNVIGLNTELSAGGYVLIGQWSSALGRMRVGLFNPTTGALTWSSPTLETGTTYRGFFPITTTGGQRLRWGYGLSGFPVGIGDSYFFNSVITDNDIMLMCRNMTT